jgi:hypothetical protein
MVNQVLWRKRDAESEIEIEEVSQEGWREAGTQ